MIAAMTVESPTDGDVFLAYVEQVLCPRLQPGQMVVMDNLPAHKVEGVRRLLQAVGAAVLTTLFARPQSHRASMVENQTAAPFGQGAHGGNAAISDCGRLGRG
jgi:transposase